MLRVITGIISEEAAKPSHPQIKTKYLNISAQHFYSKISGLCYFLKSKVKHVGNKIRYLGVY